ncbi:MAG: PAS domain S-box protein [Dehalococcoidales bacterium]|nr:PAS domain S-box protein [Dehalococcoidales bacterium]
MRFLVVDDDKDSRKLLNIILEGKGYEVDSVNNGIEAIERLHSQVFDMIISDIMMPDMDGFQLCLECKKDPVLKEIPFVFYTASYTDDKDEELALKIGADLFIRKPIEPDEFLSTVQLVLSRHRESKSSHSYPTNIEDNEVLTLYSERLVNKLEEKVIELEAVNARMQRTEADLQKSEQMYQMLVEDLPIALSVVQDGKIVFTNRYVEIITGYSEDKLKTIDGFNLIHPEDREKVRSFLQKRFRNEQAPDSYVLRVIHKDGQVLWFDRRPISITWEGKPAILVLDKDITGQMKAQQMLDEEITWRRILMDQSSDGIVILDITGKVVEANIQFARMHGYSPEEARHLHIWDWSAPLSNGEVPENLYTIDEKGDRFEVQHIRKDRSEFSVEISSNAAVFNGEKLIFCVVRDITERKQAEEALQSKTAFLEAILNSSVDGIIVVGLNRKKLYINHRFSELFKVPQGIIDDPNDTALREYAATMVKDPELFLEKIIDFDEHKDEIGHDEIELKSGVVLDRYCEPVLDAEGNYMGRVWTFRDITESKQAQDKVIQIETLKKLNQAKSELLSNVSHELRTPLASIKGFIETLIEPDVEWTRQQQMDFLQIADKETDRLSFLIRDLLDMSRIDSGNMKLEKHSLSINEILDSIDGLLSIITEKHKFQIIQAPDLPPVQADKFRIGQVITNLVENAAKFSAEGALIIIRVEASGENVVFSIEDNGEGMSPETVSNLFDRFYQAHPVVSGKTRGTGLGLAICKGIIEVHGGRIWVDSQPGKGSKFYFSLPIT